MKIQIDDNAYYDIPELVKILAISRKSLYAWIKEGKLKTHKLGRKHVVLGKVLRLFIESA